jgi:Chaperone of endosialidase/Nif11 domain
MSLQAAKDFIEAAKKSPAISQETHDRSKNIVDVGREHGFEFSKEELRQAMDEDPDIDEADPDTCICGSDRNTKENFAAVDGEDILRRLRSVPIMTWNYKRQPATVRHIGPMAQDFKAAFHVGEDERHIAVVDPNGVALAAAKALDEQTSIQEQRIEALQKENEELQRRIERLESLLLAPAS